MKVCEAWDEYHENRRRDAVYPYLSAVFEIVEHYKIRRRTERLKRRACAVSGITFDKNADPVNTVIRCTCEENLDNKMISKWTRALRYVAKRKKRGVPVKAFVKKMGGINACAGRYGENLVLAADDNSPADQKPTRPVGRQLLALKDCNLLGKCCFIASSKCAYWPFFKQEDCRTDVGLR